MGYSSSEAQNRYIALEIVFDLVVGDPKARAMTKIPESVSLNVNNIQGAEVDLNSSVNYLQAWPCTLIPSSDPSLMGNVISLVLSGHLTQSIDPADKSTMYDYYDK